MRLATAHLLLLLVMGWLLLAGFSLSLGHYAMPLSRVGAVLLEPFGLNSIAVNATERVVIWTVRLPRMLTATLVGGGLAIAGAALQGIFRNPLVGPHIIGISTGATVGGAFSILLGLGSLALLGMSFASGMLALLLVFALTSTLPRSNTLALVLAGVVLSGFFAALVSLIQYTADAEEVLPVIVYWLMGSFASASYYKLALLLIPVLLGSVLLILMSWRINVLSLGDEEARGLNVNAGVLRWSLLTLIAAIVSAQVAVSGSIGWVGLVIPHGARALTGPDHRKLLPVSFMMGALFMVFIDDLARTLSHSEIPLSILTAIIGAPVFVWLLRRSQSRGWND